MCVYGVHCCLIFHMQCYCFINKKWMKMHYESSRMFIKAGDSLLIVEISWHFTTFFIGFVWLSEYMVPNTRESIAF
jgi:hypothetical protein